MAKGFLKFMRRLYRRCENYPKLGRLLLSVLPAADVAYAGCTFRTHPADNYSEFFLWLCGVPPEHEATKFLRGLFAGRKISMVDVGANAGVFSLPIAEAAAPGSTFVLFEPNPVMRRRLAANIKRNRFQNIRVMENAIGDEETRQMLHFPRRQNLGEGRLGLAYPSSGRKAIEVAVRPLPACLNELAVKEIGLLKVDVEGLEDRVIMPLLTAEAPKPDFIYFEDAHSRLWKDDLPAALASSGYALVRRFGPNAFYQRT